jgi:hypothetical protein
MRDPEPESDPTRFLDGWRAPVKLPDAAPNLSGLPTATPSLSAERLQRLRDRGYAMQDVEDVELPASPPPAVPAWAEIQQSLTRAAEQARPPALRPAADPRVLSRWQPLAWSGRLRKIAEVSAEVVQTPQGPVVENRPPGWLFAIWPPQRLESPLLGRWPEHVGLVEADDVSHVQSAMLAALPPEARLWLSDLDIDWALIAEIELHQDPNLRSSITNTLRQLVQAEREAAFAKVNQDYERVRGAIRRKPR